MSMSVAGEGGDDKPMSDINTTPLVDVMLVLLIIFLITIPVVVQSVQLKLPAVRHEVTTTKPENVSLSVRGGPGGKCEIYWNQTLINSDDLFTRATQKLEAEIKKAGGVQNMNLDNLPEAHIRGDVNAPYKCIGGAIYTMQRAGFARVGFISEPPPGEVTTRF